VFACEKIINGETKEMELRRIPLVHRLSDGMRVYVKTLTGKTLEFDVTPD
jgi:hypothetical protein